MADASPATTTTATNAPVTTTATATPGADKATGSSLVTAPPAADSGKPAEKTATAPPPTNPDAPKAPEKYELKLPEGSLLDEHAIEKTAAYAKAQGLSAEQAQALLERESGVVGEYMEAQQAALESKAAQWVDEIKADKEIGGVNFGKNVELAKRVVARFAPEGLKKTLNETGLGNHPDLVRMLVAIGKASAEDTLVVPSAKTAATQKTPAQILFPELEATVPE